jgi:4-hydroxybenzoyl-CoA thioesterase
MKDHEQTLPLPTSTHQGTTTSAPVASPEPPAPPSAAVPPGAAAPPSAAPWQASFPVRFGDIDQAGIVYYPRFLHYCHVAMEDFFADRLGLPYPELLTRHRIGFPTVQLDVTFRRPLRYGDHFAVTVTMAHLGTSSLTWQFQLLRITGDGTQELSATARAVTVCTDLDRFAKVAIPTWLADRLQTAA